MPEEGQIRPVALWRFGGVVDFASCRRAQANESVSVL
jgi:hypothetical protein